MGLNDSNKSNINRCLEFFKDLSIALNESHEVVGSCNQDLSSYLIPKGTRREVSYYSKPENSFRISDHWNWFANVKRCKDEHYVQCFSRDLPWPKKRKEKGLASEPIRALAVCYMGSDRTYHVIFGEKFDRKTKTWSWVDNTVESVISKLEY